MHCVMHLRYRRGIGRICSSILRRQNYPDHSCVRFSYSKQVLSNLTNYKSFGFTKIVPRIPAEQFEAVVQNTVNKDKATLLWDKVA